MNTFAQEEIETEMLVKAASSHNAESLYLQYLSGELCVQGQSESIHLWFQTTLKKLLCHLHWTCLWNMGAECIWTITLLQWGYVKCVCVLQRWDIPIFWLCITCLPFLHCLHCVLISQPAIKKTDVTVPLCADNWLSQQHRCSLITTQNAVIHPNKGGKYTLQQHF